MPGTAQERSSGVLLHVTSLPGDFGVGDLGPSAGHWIEFLASARQRWWQVLPLNPTSPAGAHSPYQSTSAFAGNPMLICPLALRDAGYVSDADIAAATLPHVPHVDFTAVLAAKAALFDRAYEHLEGGSAADLKLRFQDFCEAEGYWLDDYALFTAIQRDERAPWWEWPENLRRREADALAGAHIRLYDQFRSEQFRQFLFHEQWEAVRGRAREAGIGIIGDIPYYVGADSADVWANQDLFKLDEHGRARFVGGVPPDRFADHGQLWSNPVYDWVRHIETDFEWWRSRITRNLQLFDRVRIDHFRGLASYWEVPGEAHNAAGGKWVSAPGRALLDAVVADHPRDAFIAEDLGVITDDVRDLIARYDLPGMNVLLFAFDSDDSIYAPHRHRPNSVVFTGTHDNNTTRGWFEQNASDDDKRRLAAYLGYAPTPTQVSWDMLRLAQSSVADLCIVPMQDLLALDASARMNVPGTESGNWTWRLMPGEIRHDIAERLAELTRTFGRA